MEYEKAKAQYIDAWGNLGSSWGINKAMAQIHALLLIQTDALNADQIMEELNMSRGNVNMNLRALLDWGIVEKKNIAGDRKEYFIAEKDIWELARQVSRERRKREIEPIIKVLSKVQEVEGEGKEIDEFKTITSKIKDFSLKIDEALEKFTKSDQSWFIKLLMKL